MTRAPIREALDGLAHAFRLSTLDVDGSTVPVILLPLNEWIAMQNAITFEKGSMPEERRLQPTPAREFCYCNFVFRIDRGAS